MEHTPHLSFLGEALLFLTLAGLLIPLLQRFRINQVLGFLAVGIALGPQGIGQWAGQWPALQPFTFTQVGGVQAFGELGVVFLMFLIGLELSPERLWAMRGWVFLGGTAQILLSSLAIGLLAWAFGNPPEVALVLGLVLSLSSTAVVMQLLPGRGGIASPVGRASFAVLMMQDFAVVPILVLVDLLARDSSAGFGSLLGLAALKSALAILVIFVAGRQLLGPVFRFFANRRQPEVFMALTLLVVLGTAGLTAKAGLSLALGAFLAGLLMAETEYRHEVEVTIEPFKGLLMGLFFMSVGMGIDPAQVWRQPVWLAASVVGLVVLKAVIAGTVLRLGGLTRGGAVEGGLLLGQGGEFAFVVVGVAQATGLLGRDVAQFMLLVVSFSLLVTPGVSHLGRWIGHRLDRREAGTGGVEGVPPAWNEQASGHVVIVGFGRVGQLLAGVLAQQQVPYVALEQDARVASAQRRLGKPVFYGNAARAELLDKLRTRHAVALMVTMDQPAAAMHAVRAARVAYPQLPIYARSRDEAHARELLEAGATGVVPETLEAGLQLTAFALRAADLPEAQVGEAVAAERQARI